MQTETKPLTWQEKYPMVKVGLSLREAARIADVDVAVIRAWIMKGVRREDGKRIYLNSYRIGKLVHTTEAFLDEFFLRTNGRDE